MTHTPTRQILAVRLLVKASGQKDGLMLQIWNGLYIDILFMCWFPYCICDWHNETNVYNIQLIKRIDANNKTLQFMI